MPPEGVLCLSEWHMWYSFFGPHLNSAWVKKGLVSFTSQPFSIFANDLKVLTVLRIMLQWSLKSENLFSLSFEWLRSICKETCFLSCLGEKILIKMVWVFLREESKLWVYKFLSTELCVVALYQLELIHYLPPIFASSLKIFLHMKSTLFLFYFNYF